MVQHNVPLYLDMCVVLWVEAVFELYMKALLHYLYHMQTLSQLVLMFNEVSYI